MYWGSLQLAWAGLLTEAWTIHLRTRSFLRRQGLRLERWLQWLRAMSLVPHQETHSPPVGPATGNPSSGLLEYLHTCTHRTHAHTHMCIQIHINLKVSIFLNKVGVHFEWECCIDAKSGREEIAAGGKWRTFYIPFTNIFIPLISHHHSIEQVFSNYREKKKQIYNGQLYFVTSFSCCSIH